VSDLYCFALCHSACLLDICFVVDHSGSIRDKNVGNVDNWQLVLEFMAHLVSYMNISTYGTNAGSVMFGMYSDLGLCHHQRFGPALHRTPLYTVRHKN